MFLLLAIHYLLFVCKTNHAIFLQIKLIPFEHDCPTTKLEDSKMATQGWVAEKLADWVKKNPGEGAKAARTKLEADFNFQLKYSKAWAGMRLALDRMHGKYEDSFQLLFSWKAEIEKRCPGSIVEIDLLKKKTSTISTESL